MIVYCCLKILYEVVNHPGQIEGENTAKFVEEQRDTRVASQSFVMVSLLLFPFDSSVSDFGAAACHLDAISWVCIIIASLDCLAMR